MEIDAGFNGQMNDDFINMTEMSNLTAVRKLLWPLVNLLLNMWNMRFPRPTRVKNKQVIEQKKSWFFMGSVLLWIITVWPYMAPVSLRCKDLTVLRFRYALSVCADDDDHDDGS